MASRDEINDKWEEIMTLVDNSMMHSSFEKWIKPLKPLFYDEEQSILYVRSKLKPVDYPETRYLPKLQETINDVFGTEVRLHFIPEDAADPDAAPGSGSQQAERKATSEALRNSRLNENYKFKTFVVGDNNNIAFAACKAVAERPVSQTSNPLFIYGNSGLGKTHLMQAIGHEVLEKHPEKKVVYVSSEMFTNDLISSLQGQNMEAFRAKYRNIDYLLIDDIQFIEKKDRTQEEMFHTFEELYSKQKQIVFTSDRPPKDIATIDQRLRSRFEWGLSVDIHEPDFETRVAILKNKASMIDTTLHVESEEELQAIFFLIAENITTNIRELEGALNQLIAYAEFTNRPLNKTLAMEVLSRTFNIHKRAVDIALIKEVVCSYFDISIADIESSKRPKNLSYPRQIAMYLCREITDDSYPKIGSSFGKKDHTTVMHACEKIAKDLKSDEELQKTVEELRTRIMER